MPSVVAARKGINLQPSEFPDMAGALNFTLGLQTASALGNLNNFNAGLNSMLSRATALGGALAGLAGPGAGFAGIGKEISEGGRLFDTSKRTGESVDTLYKLENAFQDIGIAAGNVPGLIGMVQKSLGGVNEMGEPTNEVFKSIGLSIEELKNMSADQQLLKIGKALAGLGKAEAFNIASKISRGGAGDLVQIGRSADDFAEALERAARRAAIMGQNAAAFDRIGDTMRNIKEDSRGLFLNIAVGAAPGIQSFLNTLERIDLSGFGKNIGDALAASAQAFKEGHFGEFASAGMSAAFEKSSLFFSNLIADPALYSGMSEAMVGALAPFGKALLNLSSLFQDFFISKFLAGIEEITAGIANSKLGQLLGLAQGPALGFEQIFATKRALSKAGMDALLGDDETFAKNAALVFGSGAKDLGGALARAWGASGGPMQEAFAAMQTGFLGRAPGPGGAGGIIDIDKLLSFAGILNARNLGGAGGLFKGGGGNSAVSPLERLGLVNLPNNPSFGAGRETARNTGEMLKVLRTSLETQKAFLQAVNGLDFGNLN